MVGLLLVACVRAFAVDAKQMPPAKAKTRKKINELRRRTMGHSHGPRTMSYERVVYRRPSTHIVLSAAVEMEKNKNRFNGMQSEGRSRMAKNHYRKGRARPHLKRFSFSPFRFVCLFLFLGMEGPEMRWNREVRSQRRGWWWRWRCLYFVRRISS